VLQANNVHCNSDEIREATKGTFANLSSNVRHILHFHKEHHYDYNIVIACKD